MLPTYADRQINIVGPAKGLDNGKAFDCLRAGPERNEHPHSHPRCRLRILKKAPSKCCGEHCCINRVGANIAPPQTSGLLPEAEEPFEAGALGPPWRSADVPCIDIECT